MPLGGRKFSLGSLVGFVTLFGTAARNAILLLSQAERLVTVDGQRWSIGKAGDRHAPMHAPILMATLAMRVSLLPLAIGIGQAGREIQGPRRS